MTLLEVDSLQVNYGQIKGTDGLSFTVNERETVALVGVNGAGKSSTVKAIVVLHNHYTGTILWKKSQDLKQLPPSDIVRVGIGYSPEGRRVFPAMSVEDNLRVGAFTISRDRFRERCEQMYDYFPRLRERFRQRAGSLSGGEQQMLAIARALMTSPQLLLLDEPSLGLAPIVISHIGEIIKQIQEKEGLSVILAEHNVNWALRVAQRAVILELGRVVMEGSAAELMKDPAVQSAYLGV